MLITQNHEGLSKWFFKNVIWHIETKKAYTDVWGQMWRKGTWQRQGWLLRVIGISCLNCGSGVLSVCVCQSSLNFILNWYSLLYRDHSSMKLISETFIGRKEYRIWQNNLTTLQIYKTTSLKGAGEEVLI